MGEHLFEEIEQAQLYQLYRIGYEGNGIEEQLLTSLSCKLQQVPLSCAVDIGCGTGFFTRLLSAHFPKVIGVDCSFAQLEEARRATPQTNIEYILGAAEDLSFIPDNSAELISVAAALHYFDIDKFFLEVDRILVPSGCLCVLMLMNGQALEPIRVRPDTTNTKVIKDFEELMTEFWHFFFQQFEESTQTKLLEGTPKPPGLFQEEVFEVTTSQVDNIDDLIGLLKSVGVVQKYCKLNPEQMNVLDVYRRRFLEILGEVSATPKEVKMTFSSRLNCWLFRKPENQTENITSADKQCEVNAHNSNR